MIGKNSRMLIVSTAAYGSRKPNRTTRGKGKAMRTISRKMKGKFLVPFVVAALAVFLSPPLASAAPVLSSDLASFAVLGATTVTNTGSTTLNNGNVGVDPGGAIVPGSTGFTFSTSGTGMIVNGIANTAQTDLGIALGLLQGLASSSTISGGVLDGLSLGQGVYAVSAAPGNGGFNLSTDGVLTLDAQNLLNPFWVFQMDSTLITGSNAVVQFANAAAGFNPGVYWAVGSSATLGTTTSFQGNILAHTSITLNTSATIGCGSALANTGAVTMDTNTIGIGCAGTGLEFDTGGNLILIDTTTGGGGTIVAGAAPVPEPGTMVLLGSGLVGLVGWGRRKLRK